MSYLFEGIVCMDEGVDVSGVIQRLRQLYGVDTDAALSDALGVAKTTLSSWRKNARVPFPECVQAVRKYRCSWDWLLTGAGAGAVGGVRDEGEIYVTDERMQRIAAFLQHWGATRNADEKAWLEMQLARAVPEYAEWLATRSKA